MTTELPRGIRNFNPGNIRRGGVTWQGMDPTQADPVFITFMSPQWGIRAMVKILRNYKSLGLTTIRQVITRWAPYSENNTDAYIAAVCAECAVGPDDQIDFDSVMVLLVRAITYFENGACPYTDDVIRAGIALAQ
jgi:hypothetical protein